MLIILQNYYDTYYIVLDLFVLFLTLVFELLTIIDPFFRHFYIINIIVIQ